MGAVPAEIREAVRHSQTRPISERIDLISKAMLNQQYAIDPLGEGNEEKTNGMEKGKIGRSSSLPNSPEVASFAVDVICSGLDVLFPSPRGCFDLLRSLLAKTAFSRTSLSAPGLVPVPWNNSKKRRQSQVLLSALCRALISTRALNPPPAEIDGSRRKKNEEIRQL